MVSNENLPSIINMIIPGFAGIIITYTLHIRSSKYVHVLFMFSCEIGFDLLFILHAKHENKLSQRTQVK